MKKRFLALFLIAALLFPGCARSVDQQLEVVEDALEQQIDTVEDAIEDALNTPPTKVPLLTAPPTEPPPATDGELTEEEARDIALKHAGFTADQVTGLRTIFEIEHSVPQYEVEFHQERWEYEYEINAITGEIISMDKDD